MAQKEKKGPMIALWMGIGILILMAIVLFIGYQVFFGSDGSDKRYGGAKIKTTQIWSADGLTVSADKLDRYYSGSLERDALYLKVKNDTGSPQLLRCSSLSINGAAIQPELMLEAAPGKETSGAVLFDKSSFYDMQLWTVGTICLELVAFDPSSMTETARSGPIVIETNKTKKADTPRLYHESDPVYNKNGISIGTAGLSVAYTTESSALRFYVENTTDTDIRIIPAEMKVNGTPYEVKRKNADQTDYDTRGLGEGWVFPAGSKGTFYYELEWEPLEDVLPLDSITGELQICEYSSGQMIDTALLDYQYK